MKKWWLTGVLQDEAGDGDGGGGDSSADDKGSKKGKDESQEDGDGEDGDEKDDPEEVKEALNLFRGLKDPKKSTGILKYLATEAGLLTADGDVSKKGENASDDKILKTLQKHLGEYKWIAPQFAGALKELLEEQKTEIEGKFGELSVREQQRDIGNAIGELTSQYKDFKLYHPKIVKLMDEITCGDNTPPKVYLTKLYKLAKAEAGDTKDASNNGRGDKLKKNATDATARLSSSGGKDDEHKKASKALPNRREAIEMALKQLEEEED